MKTIKRGLSVLVAIAVLVMLALPAGAVLEDDSVASIESTLETTADTPTSETILEIEVELNEESEEPEEPEETINEILPEAPDIDGGDPEEDSGFEGSDTAQVEPLPEEPEQTLTDETEEGAFAPPYDISFSSTGKGVIIANMNAGELEEIIDYIVEEMGNYFIRSHQDIDGLTITGTMNADDMDYIYKGPEVGTVLTGVKEIDLSGTTYSDTTLAPAQFSGNTKLETVTLPGNITSIGSNAFNGCGRLANINLSNLALTEIGNDAFNLCRSLPSIDLQSLPLTEIGARAFMYCYALREALLPSSLVTIGPSAFYATPVRDIDFNSLTSLTTIGDYAFYNCGSLREVDMGNLTVLSSIGSNAFYQCLNLTELVLPTSIVTIGSNAFNTCRNITSVDFTNLINLTDIGSGAFADCSSMQTIGILPSSITYLGDSAFAGCRALTSVDLTNLTQLASLGNYTFSSCVGLQSVDMTGLTNLTSIGYCTFMGCTALANVDLSTLTGLETIGGATFIRSGITDPGLGTTLPNLTSIGELTFSACNSLTSIDLSAQTNLTEIGKQTFYNCTALDNVNLAGLSGLTTIGEETFMACRQLGSIDLSSLAELTTIGKGTFKNCTGLNTVDLSSPTKLTSLGTETFEGCTALTGIDLTKQANLTAIGQHTFRGCVNFDSVAVTGLAKFNAIGYGTFYGCTSLTSFDFSSMENISSIGTDTFYGCSALTNVTFSTHPNLTAVGTRVFYGCTGLTSIDLQGLTGLTTVGGDTFNGCTELVSVNLSGITTLTSVGDGAFNGCTKLTSIDLGSATRLTSINQNAFKDCTNLTELDISGARFVVWPSSTAFENVNNAQVWVHPSYLARYESSIDWATPVSNGWVTLLADTDRTLTLQANPQEGGAITGYDLSVVQVDQEITLEAVPAPEYLFVRWEVEGATISGGNSTANPATFTIYDDTTITAHFVGIDNAITILANPTEGGTVSGSGNIPTGTNHTVRATANTGYHFVNWTENGSEVSTDANYAFTVTGARTLVANFELNAPGNHTINVSANPAAGGTVAGSGSIPENTSHTVRATANTGYHFVNWTENGSEVSTDANYTFTVTGARTLVANFELNVPGNHTINVSANPAAGGAATGSGSIVDGTNHTVRATANTGYHFVNWTENGSEVSTDANYAFTVTGTRTLVANFKADAAHVVPLTFNGLPENNTVHIGESFTLVPSEDGNLLQDGQTGSIGWYWNSVHFSASFNSPATFKALKEGVSTIIYTSADGRTVSAQITVRKTSSDNGDSRDGGRGVVQTGDNKSIYAYIMTCLLASALTVGLLIQKRRKNSFK